MKSTSSRSLPLSACPQRLSPAFGLVLAVITFLALLALPARAGDASASGQWSKAEVKTSGSWSLEGRTLSLTGLSTKSGPDLKLILSPHAFDDLTSANAMTGAVVISPLKSHRGDQVYTLPANLDLSKYHSLGIHCEKFTKLFAKSAL